MFKKITFLVILTLTLALMSSCGSGASPSTPTDIPVALEGIEGATDVNVASSFSYTFDEGADISTVNTGNFYLVIGTEDDCDPDNAVEATVTCESENVCTLDPTEDLTESVQYTACIDGDSSSSSVSAGKGYLPTKDDIEGQRRLRYTFITETEMTLDRCRSTFQGPCTWDGTSTPAEGDTFDYDDFVSIHEQLGGSEWQLLCGCVYHTRGYTVCAPYDETVITNCGYDVSGSDESGDTSEYINWGSGLEDDAIITIGGFVSSTVAFSTSVTLTQQDGEDISNVDYWFGGQYVDTGGGNYSTIEEGLCDGQTSCSLEATEAEVGSMITAQTGIDNANWTADSRCLEFQLHWQLSGLDSNYHTDSDADSGGVQSGSGQRTVYFHNGVGDCPN